MPLDREYHLCDSVYGDIDLAEPIAALIRTPVVQRLRDVRLSNIDSLDMPGIAGITRYEHAIGAAYLASIAPLGSQLSLEEHLLLEAAALLHDAGITPYGHLAEEALKNVGVFSHENKWAQLFEGDDSAEPGSFNMQVYRGRQSGLRPWAIRLFGAENAQRCLSLVLEAIRGEGKLGQCIVGDIDLDNVDNLTRMAYHMGVLTRRSLGAEIVSMLAELTADGKPVFKEAIVPLIDEWLELRAVVYGRLMLAKSDFRAKAMLLDAAVRSYRERLIPPERWNYTDREFVNALLDTGDRHVMDTVDRWLIGDLWAGSRLVWLRGDVPSFERLGAFSKQVDIGRHIATYAIRDKRHRKVRLQTVTGRVIERGENPTQWVFGVVSSTRGEFTSREEQSVINAAERFFDAQYVGAVDADLPAVHTLFDSTSV
jgi:uncharacterized protein